MDSGASPEQPDPGVVLRDRSAALADRLNAFVREVVRTR